MEKTTYSGKEVKIKIAPHIFFSIFDDMSRIGENLPDDMKDSVVCDTDSLSITKGGFTLGVKRGECIPFSKVSLNSMESTPLDFEIRFFITPEGIDSSIIRIELDTELNAMMKMVMGGRLQQIVDKLTSYLGELNEDTFRKLKEQDEQLHS